MIQSGLAWIPWLLAAVHRLTETAEDGRAATRPPLAPGRPNPGGVGWLMLLSAATTLCALAGHPEVFLQGLLVAGAYTAWRLWALARGDGRAAAASTGLWLAAAVGTGILGGMVQLLPQLELARTSFRSGSASYEEVVGWAFGLRQAITFLIPDFYGNPAHHAVRLLDGSLRALRDDAMWGTAWGTKNYVEAAAYPGIMVLLLAPIGLLAARRRGVALGFALLGLVALSFCFGAPTYRLLFLGVPGFDQLHTPFRWVFAVDLALVVLAGMGFDALHGGGRGPWQGPGRSGWRPTLAAGWAWGWALVGALGLALLAWGRLVPWGWSRLIAGLFDALGCPGGHCAMDAALDRFGSGEVLDAYQRGNFLHLFLFTTLGGVATVQLLLSRNAPRRGQRWAPVLTLALLGLDLGLVGFGFNPSTDPSLVKLRPDLVRELQGMVAAKWGRVTAFGESRLLWPNTAMRFQLPDLRAYDSILPSWTTTSLGRVEDQSGWLAYNRLGNLTTAAGISHPLLSALGLRYIVSDRPLAHPQLRELYQEPEGDLRIYERDGALPRAWVVDKATVIGRRDDLLAALDHLDPAVEVLLEERPDQAIWRDLPAGRTVRASTRILRDRERADQLEVAVEGAPTGGLLVVGDAWFPGWKATVEVAGAGGARRTVEVPVYRADGMLRAVPVPPGYSVVRLAYRPTSIKAGIYGSFLGLILLVLAAAYAIGGRTLRLDGADELRRAAQNSALPFAANLLGKLIQFGFAMLMLRIISPTEAGRYTVAVTLIGLTDIVANFGLSVWATREAAQRPAEQDRILGQSLFLRLLLWLAAGGLLWAYVAYRGGAPSGGLSPDTRLAIALLALGLLPSQFSAALSSIFQGREQLVLPALVGLATTLVNVSIGAALLLAGGGIAGVAAASIVSNLATLGIFIALAARAGIRPRWWGAWSGLGLILAACWPLMLNGLLQTLFFKMDVLLLQGLLPRDGDTILGWYQAAYKWIDALLIISPSIVMAIFPLLSRRAAGDRAGLARAYVTTLRWLLMAALPISLATSGLAEPLIGLLAGAQYLPEGANALKVMVWFLPLSFANGLAQYVLIALGRQRWITLSFLAAAAFNLGANWLVIPGHQFGALTIPAYTYIGAAVVTILSEIVLWLPFSRGLRDLDTPPLLVLLWRPAMATALAALAMMGTGGLGLPLPLATLLGLAVYALALLRLGGIGDADRELLRRVLGKGGEGAT
jgi:O-antigen/teichoic acid export membrane protein